MMQRMFQPHGLTEYPPYPSRLPIPHHSLYSWKPNVYPHIPTRSPFHDNRLIPGYLPWPQLNRTRLDPEPPPFLYSAADFKHELARPISHSYLPDFRPSGTTTPFSPWTGCSVSQAAFNEFTASRFHPYPEERDLSRMLLPDAPVKKKRVRRRCSRSPPKTVSPGDVAHHAVRNKPLTDMSAMGTYYDFRHPEKKTEADSTGCQEVKREPSLQRLLNISKQIAASLPLREPVSVCTEADFPRPEVLHEDDSSDDSYELLPSLVIDLPEEDAPETADLSPVPSIGCDDDKLTVELRLKSSSTPHNLTTSQTYLPTARGPAPLSPASVVQSHPPEVKPQPVDVKPHRQTEVKQGKFRCQRCFLSFNSITMLIQHRDDCKSSPSGNSPDFTCKVCSKEFPTSKACSDHWEEYHSPARPYSCSTCGRRFTVDRALEKHSWTHK